MRDLPSPMEFPVSNVGIRAALDRLLTFADAAGIARPVAHRMAVIVDEYCSNLIRHDASTTPESRFAIAVETVDGSAVLTIRDHGVPFDPSADRPPRERDFGGQGIVLMKGLAARLEYRSSGGHNRFRATFVGD